MNGKSIGCATRSFLLGAGAMAGGVYLMNRWDTLAGPGRAGAVVLVVIAALLLLPALLIVGLRVAAKILLRKVTNEFGTAAEQMVNFNKSMYGSDHEYRAAEEKDFDGLDRSFYDRMTAVLAEQGFRHLGDVVDATIESFTDKGSPVRGLSSPDGTTLAAIYDASRAMPKNRAASDAQPTMRIFEFETEFSDGTFLLTSTAAQAALASISPRIQRHFHPADTPPLDLLHLHESEKQKRLAATPGLTCVACNTLAEALALQQRQQRAKNEFRKELGYVDPAEVRRIAEQMNADPDFIDQAADAVNETRKRSKPNE